MQANTKKESTAKPTRWHKLDNTANLFPVITSKKGSNVYRLSLNINKPVEPELLQKALEHVLPQFAAFPVRLRRGLFWHYLETNPATPLVQQEDDYPCRVMDPRANNNFLFKITYYGCRINLEVYHVISDGTGGMQFLQAVVCQYLMLANPADFTAEQKAYPWLTAHAGNTEDSYAQNYTPTKKKNYSIGRGYRIKGERNLMEGLSVIHFHVPVDEILTYCRGKGVSLTQYITACIGWAVYTQHMNSRPPKYPLNIFIPVNLRSLFESHTMLNFFSNIYISLPFTPEGITFDEVLQEVRKQFKEKLNKEEMLQKISFTVGGANSPVARAAPLPLKKLFLKIMYKHSAKSSSLGYSNIGKVEMPAEFKPYVTGASLMLSTLATEPVKFTTCSYEGRFTITATSVLRSMGIQKAIARKLAEDGLAVTVESNGVDYESL